MLGTTVDGVSMDTPSTLASVSDSGGLRGRDTDVDVTTGGSMRWVILSMGATTAIAVVQGGSWGGGVLAVAGAASASTSATGWPMARSPRQFQTMFLAEE